MAARKSSGKKKAAKKATKRAAKKATRAKASKKKRKGSWGGKRVGAGRPKGSGTGPSPDSRRNRVAIMLTDVELVALERVAKKRKLPVSTLAYQLLARGLQRS